ncbi:MAG: DUF539 domain-containing protein [Rubrivivax sp.]|nr:DUF539 domain-containing protein [Rubrivivax sp.]
MPATWLVVFTVTLVLIGVGVLAMAIGVIFRRPCLRGSCGGPEVKTADGQSIACATCPKRKNKPNASRA